MRRGSKHGLSFLLSGSWWCDLSLRAGCRIRPPEFKFVNTPIFPPEMGCPVITRGVRLMRVSWINYQFKTGWWQLGAKRCNKFAFTKQRRRKFSFWILFCFNLKLCFCTFVSAFSVCAAGLGRRLYPKIKDIFLIFALHSKLTPAIHYSHEINFHQQQNKQQERTKFPSQKAEKCFCCVCNHFRWHI